MARNSERAYELLVRVGASNLTTVIDVLKSAAEIVSLKQIEAGDSPPMKVEPQRGPRPIGKTGPQIILEHMQARPAILEWSTEDLGIVLENNGFSAASAHPAVSSLVKEGTVERHRRAYCRLIGPAKAV